MAVAATAVSALYHGNLLRTARVVIAVRCFLCYSVIRRPHPNPSHPCSAIRSLCEYLHCAQPLAPNFPSIQSKSILRYAVPIDALLHTISFAFSLRNAVQRCALRIRAQSAVVFGETCSATLSCDICTATAFKSRSPGGTLHICQPPAKYEHVQLLPRLLPFPSPQASVATWKPHALTCYVLVAFNVGASLTFAFCLC